MTTKFFDTESAADDCMRARNRSTAGCRNRELAVVVSGPTDNFAVMGLRDAIDGGFLYRWEA